jgi:hypothetical protein
LNVERTEGLIIFGNSPSEGPRPHVESEAASIQAILAQELANTSSRTRYLFSCRFTKIMYVNLHLLRLCLVTRKQKGIYVSLDRPHSYTQMALKKMGTPLDGLIFIDAISKLTGTRAEDSMVRFFAGGFNLPILDDLFSRAYVAEGDQRHYVNLEDLHFILVDNVNVMLQYCSMEKTRKMLAGLTDLVKKYTNIRTFIVLDPASSRELYEFLKGLSDWELPIKENWL